MKCAVCGTELGHPDAYCPVCWAPDREREARDAAQREAHEAAMRELYEAEMAEMYALDMEELGASWGCA